MALLRVYSIYDRKAEAYMQPFFFNSDGQATRALSDMARDTEHVVGRHPEDFDLYCIGAFADDTGMLGNPADKPRFIVACSSLVNRDS